MRIAHLVRVYAFLLCAVTGSAAAQHPDPLIIVQDHAWAPFAFRGEDGAPQGLLVDLWREVGERMGRPVRFELVDWQSTLERTRDEPGRIHGGLFRSPEREHYLAFSRELFPLRAAAFVRVDDSTVRVLETGDLAGHTVGSTAGGFEEEFMRREHPEVSLRLYDNNEELVRAAARGELDAFVADYPVGMYYLGRYASPEDFRVLQVLYRQPLHAAVAKGDAALLAEVNQALATLDEATLTRIVEKWMHSESVEVLPRWLLPAAAVLLGLLLVLGLLAYTRLLRSQVTQQTRALSEREGRLRLLTDNMSDVVWSVDPDGRYDYVSPSVQRMLGLSPEQIVGQPLAGPLSEASAHKVRELLAELQSAAQRGELIGHRDVLTEIAARHRDGHLVWTEAASRFFFDAAGEFAGIQGTSREISERREAQATIEQLAFYDPLTALPNRRLLVERLQGALARGVRSGQYGALLYIDLDNFKTLNDSRGHHVGDLLLEQVARRLLDCVRASDTVARLGGDEFVVLVEELGERRGQATREAARLAEKIIASLNQPFVLDHWEQHTSPSIGLALFFGDDCGVDELLRQADMAMYRAKQAGRNTQRFFDPAMQADADARAELELDLRQALAKGEFELHYQVQVDRSGAAIGAEGLLRWTRDGEGPVPPWRFIPVAEQTGLIVGIGYWVLEAACRQLAAWQAQPLTRGLSLAVNVSARQFQQPDFVERVRALLTSTGAPARQLKLELTESVILDGVEATIAKMEALQRLGVGFSLDDFGTGYSSLSYLNRLPLDQLKIDQSFVRHVQEGGNDAAIAQTVIALGRSLRLPVLAEGVESEAQHEFLLAHGCDAFQGYRFGRPVPLAEFQDALAELADVRSAATTR